jgi:5-methylcytosine-specific restriction endonuclease McrA
VQKPEISIHQQIRQRRRKRKKQMKINAQLKRRLYENVFLAPCCYCHKVFLMIHLTVEHITPLSLGGTNEETNIALACAPCNQEKGKEAWHFKRKLLREQYEQHSSQHQRQGGQEPLQDT